MNKEIYQNQPAQKLSHKILNWVVLAYILLFVFFFSNPNEALMGVLSWAILITGIIAIINVFVITIETGKGKSLLTKVLIYIAGLAIIWVIYMVSGALWLAGEVLFL